MGKNNGKLCPWCHVPREIITEKNLVNGIIYWEKYEECPECGDRKKFSNKHNRIDKFDLDQE